MNKKYYLSLLLLIAVVCFGFYLFKHKPISKTSLANPASVNCTEKGGQLTIAKNPSGGEYGVCSFADNRECEEWAFYRGECPAGGVKVTGYNTEAAKFCAIRGGEFTPYKTDSEKGYCLLKQYPSCDAEEYFKDGCTGVIYFFCQDKKTISVSFKDQSAKIILSDGRYLDLPQAMSASGARYASSDENLVFWNKGDTAFLEENGTETFTGCAVKND